MNLYNLIADGIGFNHNRRFRQQIPTTRSRWFCSISRRAYACSISRSAFRQVFGRGDLHPFNEIAIPQRLKNAMTKQMNNIFCSPFSQIMVNPVNLAFIKKPSRLCCPVPFQVGAKAFATSYKWRHIAPIPLSRFSDVTS